jgi:hypothetical protein
MGKSKGFLGREFLTWLWFQSEKNTEPFPLANPGSDKDYIIDLWIDDRVTLEASSGTVHSHTLKGGDPSQSAEAATALMTGKTPRELKLGVTIQGWGEFICTLSGDTLSPRSVHLPEPGEADGEAQDTSPLSFRLHALEALCEVIDGLFALYMDDRTEPERYAGFRSDLRSWIRSRPSGTTDLVH